MYPKHTYISLVLIVGLLCASPLLAQEPMGTAFTYQGQLKQAGTPINGLTDFEFTCWDAVSGGSQIGWAVQIACQMQRDVILSSAKPRCRGNLVCAAYELFWTARTALHTTLHPGCSKNSALMSLSLALNRMA